MWFLLYLLMAKRTKMYSIRENFDQWFGLRYLTTPRFILFNTLRHKIAIYMFCQTVHIVRLGVYNVKTQWLYYWASWSYVHEFESALSFWSVYWINFRKCNCTFFAYWIEILVIHYDISHNQVIFSWYEKILQGVVSHLKRKQ